MQFALLVSRLPHIDEARSHYDTLLALHPRDHHLTRAIVDAWRTWRARRATARALSSMRSMKRSTKQPMKRPT